MLAQFDVTPDGKRIAAVTYVGGAAQQESGQVIFLKNFFDELQRELQLNGK